MEDNDSPEGSRTFVVFPRKCLEGVQHVLEESNRADTDPSFADVGTCHPSYNEQ